MMSLGSSPKPLDRGARQPRLPAAAGEVEPDLLLARHALPGAEVLSGEGGAAAAPPARPLASAEISRRMTRDGFPEMEVLWERFQRRGIEPSALDNQQIEDARRRHMAPLFGRPLAAGAACLAAGAVVGHFYAGMLPVWGAGALGAWCGVNAAALAAYSATLWQRYWSAPLHKTMASDLASMLSRPDYRAWFDASPAARSVMQALQAHGIGTVWDDPRYRVRYRLVDGEVTPLPAETHHQFVQRVLRDFLGHKDPEKRRFCPGVWTPGLREGKRSVTAFVAVHQAAMDANRAGRLPAEEGLGLLQALRAEQVRPGSDAERVLSEAIEAVQRGDYLTEGAVEARVWQRDPWRDLTHQEEFFSSASLRGVKWMGRGPKGRLGAFGYLRNKSISALDFSTRRGRVVRVRMAAAFAREKNGVEQPLLFVDGVEGTNSLRPELVRRGIEDCARAAGFDRVLYNKWVHNQVPRRFAEYIGQNGGREVKVRLRYADADRREYLDAFGLPIEPLEYRYPRGAVIGYLTELNPEQPAEFAAPTLADRALAFCRRNVLWMLVGESSLFAGAVMAQTAPLMLLPLALGSAAGIYAHLRYQFKSVREQGG